jgi:hypothetical protein
MFSKTAWGLLALLALSGCKQTGPRADYDKLREQLGETIGKTAPLINDYVKGGGNTAGTKTVESFNKNYQTCTKIGKLAASLKTPDAEMTDPGVKSEAKILNDAAANLAADVGACDDAFSCGPTCSNGIPRLARAINALSSGAEKQGVTIPSVSAVPTSTTRPAGDAPHGGSPHGGGDAPPSPHGGGSPHGDAPPSPHGGTPPSTSL